MTIEPIRQVWQDGKREQLVADYLAKEYNWAFYPTPRYYFVDYLVNKLKPNGYANYIGGVEIKWMKSHAGSEVKFPYQKLQRMWLTEPLDDNPEAYNRIVIIYTDALLVIPARLLRSIPPVYGLTRADTQEHDFNIHFIATEDFPDYLEPIVIAE
jgi:hypothetical protein